MRAKTARIQNKEKLPELKEIIVNAVLDKKGEDVISLDLREIGETITDTFIICHATSTTQVKAIAEHVIEKTKEDLQEKPFHKEGLENFEWVLLDYLDVVVHIFIKEKRDFYQLEDLWSDAPRNEYE